jgi:hypothetical protein
VGAGEVNCFAQRQNAKVFLLGINHPHLSGANFPVNTRERSRRRKRTRRERATQEALTGWDMFMYASTVFKNAGS